MGDSLENPGAAVNGFDITAAQKKSGESQTQGPSAQVVVKNWCPSQM